jgi:hypothetical protein
VIRVLKEVKEIHQLVTKELKDHKVTEVIRVVEEILHKVMEDRQEIPPKEG